MDVLYWLITISLSISGGVLIGIPVHIFLAATFGWEFDEKTRTWS